MWSSVAAVVVLIFLANAAVVPLAEAAVAQRLTTPEGLDYRRYGRVRMWGSLGFISAVGCVRRRCCKAPASPRCRGS